MIGLGMSRSKVASNTHSDVIIIGAGAAGMMCAARAAAAGLSVQLLDHAQKLGEKSAFLGVVVVTLLISAPAGKIMSRKTHALHAMP